MSAGSERDGGSRHRDVLRRQDRRAPRGRGRTWRHRTAHPRRRRPAAGGLAVRPDREPVGPGRRAAAGQDRESGAGAARGPRPATGPAPSTSCRPRSTAAAGRSGATAPRSSAGVSRRPSRCSWSPYSGCRKSPTGLRRWCPIRSSASSAPRSTPRSAAPSIPATPVPHSNAEITMAKSGTRGIRQAHGPTRGGSRPPLTAQSGRGAPGRSQCFRAAGRPHLCLPGTDRQGRECG